jgi:hypothetical protein
MRSPRFRFPLKVWGKGQPNKNEPMKTSIFTTIFCALFALSSGAARAQDSARVPDTNPDAGSAVDASVHAGVDEQSAQPQPSQQPNKRQQTTYSHWAFQPANRSANHPSATRFQHAQAPIPLAQPEKGDDPSTLSNLPNRSETPLFDPLPHAQDAPFGISPIGGKALPRDPQSQAVRTLLQRQNSENGVQLQGLKSFSPLPSPFHPNNGFSTSLRDKKTEPSEKSPFPSPFSRPDSRSSNSLQRRPQKHIPPKPADRNKRAPLLDSKIAKQH